MKRLLALLLLAGMLSACAPVSAPVTPDPGPTPSQEIGEEDFLPAHREFARRSAMELFKDLSENYNYSPLSLTMALSMLAQGAEGETLQGIMKSMNLEGRSPLELAELMKEKLRSYEVSGEQGTLAFANALFSDNEFPLKKEFAQKLRDNFHAFAESLPLKEKASVERINNFISGQTNKRIQQAYQPAPDSEDVMLLINTLYANLPWAEPFLPEASAKRLFHAPGGDVSAMFMNQEIRAPYIKGDGYQSAGLELGQQVKMTLVLPDEGITPQDLLARENLFGELHNGAEYRRLQLSVPRFTFENTFDLKEMLQGLGMEKALTDKAEFSAISKQPTRVSAVSQKTFLDVNEKGVEAAAVTIAKMEETSEPPEEDPIPLVLDRPFLFLLETQDQLILFLGVLGNPAP